MKHSTRPNTTFPDQRPLETQPQWRRDFPIDVHEDNHVARREFVKFLTLVSGAFVVGQLWILAQSVLRGRGATPETQRIASIDEVPVGGALSFAYPGPEDRCLLVRAATDRFVAFNQLCTHLSCAVVPDATRGLLLCPCHNGSFDLESGRPLSGPPRRALPRIVLDVRDGDVFATGVEYQS